MARMSFPPGFRFHPTDVELVMYYLKRKVMGKKFQFEAISEINIYKFSPWDLPDKSCLGTKDLEWYFFCPRERKYASGVRTNRATENGYWKVTGRDRPVLYNTQNVGMVKSLVFHKGQAPRGEKTNWVIHEYRIEDKKLADAGVVQDAYVLCKVFQKSGSGPQNGAQYGAPFNEEDWNYDTEADADTLPFHNVPPSEPVVPDNQNSYVVTSMIVPGSICSRSLSEPGPSAAVTSVNQVPADVPDDDIFSLLAMFTEDHTSISIDNANNEVNNLNRDEHVEALRSSDGNDIYNGLGELGNWRELGEGGYNFSRIEETGYAPNPSPMLLGNDAAFLELNDLDTPLNRSAEANGFEQIPTGSTYASYNCYGDFEQLCYGGNFSGAVQHVSVLPEGSNGQGYCLDMFQKETGVEDNTNWGYDVNLMRQTQPDGSRDDAQYQERGRFHYHR